VAVERIPTAPKWESWSLASCFELDLNVESTSPG
jgi:hypothetical protein